MSLCSNTASFEQVWGCAPSGADVAEPAGVDDLGWFADGEDGEDGDWDARDGALLEAWAAQATGGPRRRAGLYEELRFWSLRRARIDLRVSEIVGELVADQVAEDLADQATFGVDRVGLPPLPEAEVRDRARVAVVDTAVALVGGPRRLWLQRADLGMAAAAVSRPLVDAVGAGTLGVEQACAVVKDVEEVGLVEAESAAVAEAVCSHAAGACRDGAPVGQAGFRRRLRAEIVKRTDRPRRMARAAATRHAWVASDVDGKGSFGVRGEDARCLGAFARVDAIARAVRAGGDARTLEQLRADVALDLLIFGRPAADDPTSVDHPGDPEAGWPQASVDVVISAASLLGVSDEPGRVGDVTVAASTVRRVAHGRGGVWRRIVTDPVTGYAMDAVVESYRPPADMARVVRARDGQCRAPGCTRPAARAELDHVRERRDGGPTCGDNLHCLCRGHHAKKTRRHWRAELRAGGVVSWTLPGGQVVTTSPMDYETSIRSSARVPRRIGDRGSTRPPARSSTRPPARSSARSTTRPAYPGGRMRATSSGTPSPPGSSVVGCAARWR